MAFKYGDYVFHEGVSIRRLGKHVKDIILRHSFVSWAAVIASHFYFFPFFEVFL